MTEFIDWVIAEAKQNSEFVISCSESLERQATFLLNALLVGAGGSLAFTVNLIEKHASAWQLWGMSSATLWLFTVAVIIVIKCTWSHPIYGPASDPENLLMAIDYSLDEAKKFDLEHRQYAINANRVRNDEVGKWLNISRVLAIITPVFFIIGVCVGGC